jgi:hypothetical protein
MKNYSDTLHSFEVTRENISFPFSKSTNCSMIKKISSCSIGMTRSFLDWNFIVTYGKQNVHPLRIDPMYLYITVALYP